MPHKMPKWRYALFVIIALALILFFVLLPWGYLTSRFHQTTINGFREKRNFPPSMQPVLNNISYGFYHGSPLQGVSVGKKSFQISADGKMLLVKPDYVTWVQDNNGSTQINWFFTIKTIGTVSTPYAPTAEFVPIILNELMTRGWMFQHQQYLVDFTIGYAFKSQSHSNLSFISSSAAIPTWFIGTSFIGVGTDVNTGAVETWLQGT